MTSDLWLDTTLWSAEPFNCGLVELSVGLGWGSGECRLAPACSGLPNTGVGVTVGGSSSEEVTSWSPMGSLWPAEVKDKQ